MTFPDDYPFSPPKLHLFNWNHHFSYYSTWGGCVDILGSHCWKPTYSVHSILMSLQSEYFNPSDVEMLKQYLKTEMKTFKCSGCPHDIKMKKYWPVTQYLTQKMLMYENIPKINAWSTPLLDSTKIEKKPNALDWRKDEKKVALVKMMKENTEIFSDSIFIENIFPFLNRADLIELKNVSVSWELMIQEVFANMKEPLKCSISKVSGTNCTLGFDPNSFLLISSEMFDLILKSESENFLKNYQNSNFIPLFDPFNALKLIQNKDTNQTIEIYSGLMLNLISKLKNYEIFSQDFFNCFISLHRWMIYLTEKNNLQNEFQQKFENFLKDPKSRKEISDLVPFFCLIFITEGLNVDEILNTLLFEHFSNTLGPNFEWTSFPL
jgi:hypothetical protein